MAKITADFLNNHEIHGKFTAPIYSRAVFKNTPPTSDFHTVSNHWLEN